MIDSGEAESRAVAGAVRGAIGQAHLDAGVNITGLLVDMGSAESRDYRQHLMCWQLTRVLRPSLTEKVPPSLLRRVVDQQAARSRTTATIGQRSWRVGTRRHIPVGWAMWNSHGASVLGPDFHIHDGRGHDKLKDGCSPQPGDVAITAGAPGSDHNLMLELSQ